MARGRMITNKICMDKRVAALSDDTCRLIFTWLITFADCEGRTMGDPAIVRSMLFPRNDHITIGQMDNYLQELHNTELIQRYEVDGDLYISFPAWDKNQKIRKDREAPSELPAPLLRTNSGVTQEKCGLIEYNRIEYNVNGIEVKDASPASFGENSISDVNVYTEVSGSFSPPGTKTSDVLAAIQSLRPMYPDNASMIAYLKPFYAEWRKRGYSKINPVWLTDWATSGEIPEQKNGKHPTSALVPESEVDYAALRKELAESRAKREAQKVTTDAN